MCYGEPVSEFLAQFGREIGKRPVAVLVATLLTTFILADKFVTTMTLETDLDVLFVPHGATAMVDRKTLETFFPWSSLSERFVEGHETRRPGPGVEVHLTPVRSAGGVEGDASFGEKGVPSALAPGVLKAAELVDTVIRKRLVVQTSLVGDLRNNEKPGESRRALNVTWADVCARSKGVCVNLNGFLELAPHLKAGGQGEVKLMFPFTKNPLTQQTYVVASNLGGVVFMDDDLEDDTAAANSTARGSAEVKDAASIRLFYPVDPGARWSALWEQECRSLALKFRFGRPANSTEDEGFDEVRVSAISSSTVSDELVKDVISGLDSLPLTAVILVAFGMCSALPGASDRPLVMAFGIINTLLATASAWGFIVWVIGSPFQVINLAGIFVLLGVGMDDTFLLLSAWGKVNMEDKERRQSVPTLMEHCYRESGASITISSMTNFVGFMTGVIIPGFQSVSNYCLFTGIGIVFIYVWTLVAFGAVLALSGQWERSELLASNKYYQAALKVPEAIFKGLEKVRGGGPGLNSDLTSRDEREIDGPITASQARSYFELLANVMLPKFICKLPVKLMVLALFSVYLAAAAYGVSQIKEGFDRQDLAQKTSYAQVFYQEDESYFRENPYRLTVAIVGQLDYSDQTVRAGVDELLRRVRNSPFAERRFHDFEENWLDMMDEYLAEKGRRQLGRPQLAHELAPSEFLDEVEAASAKLNGILLDYVKFERSNGSKVVAASRFFLQSSAIRNVRQEMDMVTDVRRIASDWTAWFKKDHQVPPDFEAIVFNGFFQHLDQVLSLNYQTALTLTASLAMVFLVTFLLLPSGSSHHEVEGAAAAGAPKGSTGGRTYKRSLVAATVVLVAVLSIEFCMIGMMHFAGVSLDVVSLNSLVMCVGFAVDYCAHMTYHILVSECRTGDGHVMEEAIQSGIRAVGVPILQSFLSSVLSVILFAIKPSYILRSFATLMCLVVVLGTVHGLFLLPVILPWCLLGRKGRAAPGVQPAGTENNMIRADRLHSQAAKVVSPVLPLDYLNESYVPETGDDRQKVSVCPDQ